VPEHGENTDFRSHQTGADNMRQTTDRRVTERHCLPGQMSQSAILWDSVVRATNRIAGCLKALTF
jgi:hypothetical protein